MKQNKKKVYISVLFSSILFIIIFSYFSFYKENKIVEIPEKVQIESKLPVKELVPLKSKIESVLVKDAPIDVNVKNTTIYLNVFDKNYKTQTEEGINVYDAMKSIEDKSFSFKATNYSGLGYFVEEINGVKGTPGKYWIYYVNNEKAAVGISKYILKSGDIITWKQEGI